LESTLPEASAASGVTRFRIGLSGGADSLALTAACAWARDRRRGPLAGMDVTARIVDHGLQPDSAAVADQAARRAEELGVSADVVRVRVDPSGEGLEAAAREARYAALLQGDDALILLGHTLDDQAETVLLGLARGSGTRSLAGMPRNRDRMLRPFLALRRADTEQACRDWGLTWWDDPTNLQSAYTRSRLRSAMGTLDEVLGPGLASALARTADLCRQDADFLDLAASRVGVDPQSPRLAVDLMADVPPALRHRLLLSWLRQIGQDAVTRDHVLAVDALLTDWRGQQGISVPGGRVVRESGFLVRERFSPRRRRDR